MYQGHCNDGSSIQKHSAGPLYPFVVYETHDGRVHVMHPCGLAVLVPSRDYASRFVQQVRTLAYNHDIPLIRAFWEFADTDDRHFHPFSH